MKKLSHLKALLLRRWQGTDWVGRLLILQAGSYLLLELVSLLCSIIQPLSWWDVASLLSFYPDGALLLRSPWRLVLYILPHQHFLHLLANLALIYLLLPPVLRFFGSYRMLSLYLGGAVLGGLTYLLGYHLLSAYGVEILPWSLRGCSAAFVACFTALLVQPQGLRQLRSKVSRGFLLLALLLLIFAGVSTNLGGTLAHIGGLVFGLVYGWNYRQGRDLLDPLLRRFYQTPSSSSTDEALRTKLRHSGYASLTPEERARLRQLRKSAH